MEANTVLLSSEARNLAHLNLGGTDSELQGPTHTVDFKVSITDLDFQIPVLEHQEVP